MPNPVQHISTDSITLIQSKIDDTIDNGISIRNALAEYSNSDAYDINWEVQAAVEALQVFGSRWTIEILSTLYIACLLYTSPSPRDYAASRMPSSA